MADLIGTLLDSAIVLIYYFVLFFYFCFIFFMSIQSVELMPNMAEPLARL